MTTFGQTPSNDPAYGIEYQIKILNHSSAPVSYNLLVTLLNGTSQATSQIAGTDYSQSMATGLLPLGSIDDYQGVLSPGQQVSCAFYSNGLLQSGNTPILVIGNNIGVYCRLWSGGLDFGAAYSGLSTACKDAYDAAQDVIEAAGEAEEDPFDAMKNAVKAGIGAVKALYTLCETIANSENQYVNMNSPNSASWYSSVVGTTLAGVIGCGYNITVDGGGGALSTNNIVFQVYDYTGTSQLCLITSADGSTWQSGGVAPLVMQAGPTFAVFQNTLYAAVQSPNVSSGAASNAYLIGVASRAATEGAQWGVPSVIPNQATASGPALAVFGDQLVLAFQGVNNNEVNIVTSTDGASWTAAVQIPGQTTTSTPALASFNGSLFIAFQGVGNNSINIMSTTNPMSWSGSPLILSQTTESGPALAVFQNQLFMAFRGVDNNDVNIISSTDGKTWTAPILIGQTTPSGMSMAVFNDVLYLAYQGCNNNELNIVSSANGSQWGSPQTLSQVTTLAAPALVAFMGQLVLGIQGLS